MIKQFFAGFFHRILEPHCDECKQQKACQSCETLRSILAEERFEKKQLLDIVVSKPVVDESAISVMRSAKPQFIPWAVKKQQLEREAYLAAHPQKSVDELEQELMPDKNEGVN